MVGPASTSSGAVEVSRLNVAEAALALAHSSVRRARLLANFANDVITGERRFGAAARDWLDGNESDLEELTLRWRLAGVRWPIGILLVIAFAAGVKAGRRGRR